MGIIIRFMGNSQKNNAQKREHNLLKPTPLALASASAVARRPGGLARRAEKAWFRAFGWTALVGKKSAVRFLQVLLRAFPIRLGKLELYSVL